MSRSPLILRFLGETEVVRDGAAVALPPSKKTRALLAYLAVAGGRHRRERLCSLLWDVADDPRGALRWSLSKLRAIVDDPGRERIEADRESVAFSPQGAGVDLLAIRERLAGGADAVPVEALKTLAAEFRGEFLEGLDLSDFHDFHAWCVAMREDARHARVAILESLVRRLVQAPEQALPFARALVQADPFSPSGRAHLLRLLAASGRLREATDHYENARPLIEEAGPAAAATLEATWSEIRARAHPVPAVPEAADLPTAGARAAPLVGRDDEMTRLRDLLGDVAARRHQRAAVIFGEPGIGKSRILDALVSEARAGGGVVLKGHCFEAERGRPYGPWIEALRRLPPVPMGEPLAAALAPLLGRPLPAAAGEGSRELLFGAVVDLIAARSAAPSPLLIAIDDAQWCDAASAELLHYVMRLSHNRPILIALAARDGELVDNDPVRRLLRGLRSEGISEELRIGPLAREEIGALARAIASGSDPGRVFEESRGNPLFATELARAGRPPGDDVPPRLWDVVRDRIDRLPAEPAEVLRWAAILGCVFDVDRLARVVSLGPDRLVTALEALERHALLVAASGRYTFSHEVVRRVVYADITEPRRRVMHASMARILRESSAGDESSADLAHHAALSGDAAMAALACVEAGRRCLRLFAGAEAFVLARRGERFAETLAEPDRTRRLIELTEVRLSARRPSPGEEAAAAVEELAERALDLGCSEHARLGFHLLGWLRWEQGDAPGARRHMMRAEAVSRSGGARERAVAMGEAARCLVLLEKDLGEAEALARQAGALSKRAGFEHPAIADALGMLRLHEGHHAEAAELFRRARALARRAGDPMDEFLAIEHLVAVELARDDPAAAGRLAAALIELGEKLREGSEAPFARAIDALTRCAAGEEKAREDLDGALGDLRGADAKQRLAFVLIRASRWDLAQGDAKSARSRAEEALALALVLNLPSDVVLARASLVQAADAQKDLSASRSHREALARTTWAILSAAARSAGGRLAAPVTPRMPGKRRAR